MATLIPQEAGILEARARENIAFDLEVEPARLAQALYVSAFDAVLREPPAGLETPMSERGFNLSGPRWRAACWPRRAARRCCCSTS